MDLGWWSCPGGLVLVGQRWLKSYHYNQANKDAEKKKANLKNQANQVTQAYHRNQAIPTNQTNQ